jgi:type II restriction/modification system DNA methylase subunit YeeA
MKIMNLSKALSQSLRKHKILRKDINLFKESLVSYFENIAIAQENKEHEENFKNYIAEFLKKSLFQEQLINTKERIDLAIYSGKDAKTHINVLIEVKRPSNTNEFLNEQNINKKALHELLLYYLQERVDKKNNNIKHLIATNGYEWFLFKGEDFYTHFYKNTALRKEYQAFRDGEKDSSKNELFYNEIATKYIQQVGQDLDYVYFNFKEYQEFLNLEDKKASSKENKLIPLYKILSAKHLLNQSFGNDSNQLNKQFYEELLHIIGLEEVKNKGKKVIQRVSEEKRAYGSLLESVIFTLEEKDYLRKVSKIRDYGQTKTEQVFNIALELCLTWINRVLFIKLLESQLLNYHNGNKNYRFVHQDFIQGFDDLEALFFSALAKKHSERNPRYKEKYQHIPYLNSSLFEPNKLEENVMQISNIKNENLTFHNQTILKDSNNKTLKGEKNTLAYLFDFLNAYDFGSDSKTQIEENAQNKTLMSASVLGLIFEKINGYKDGSFYTPSYITMYMSRETLRRAVIQKINTHYDWKCRNFEDLKEDLKDHIREQTDRNKSRLEVNKIMNTLRICDPAVGSGHFLVSCLNELIAIKSELKILCDDKGERLPIYIALENDELLIENENGEEFNYLPTVERTHSVQKALFHEKQNLIENCLFAVDINPNSVKICRLRLWIELLKNAYYNQNKELQTLPNIDINIKCGNSLISRFGLEDELKTAFKSKKNKYSLQDYKNAVQEYKQTNDKKRKRQIQIIIDTIKTAFKTDLDNKFKKKIAKARGEYALMQQEVANLKAFGLNVPRAKTASLKTKKNKLQLAENAKKDILTNAMYQNAFEWRFEFPEVLDEQGNFTGFDVVIGNPPYVQLQSLGEIATHYKQAGYKTFARTGDIYALFYELGNTVLKNQGLLCFITGSAWLRANYGKVLRSYFIENTTLIELIDLSDCNIFDSATVLTNILLFEKTKRDFKTKALRLTKKDENKLLYLKSYFDKNHIEIANFSENSWVISSKKKYLIKQKVEEQGVKIKDWDISINYGIKTGFNEAFIIDEKKKDKLIKQDAKNAEIIKPLLRGRDIGKYTTNFQNLWLINIHNGIKDKNIKPIDIKNYPTIKSHLDRYSTKLSKRYDKGDTFYNLRNCAYLDEFEKPKIIYPNMTKFLPFFLDKKQFYTNQKAFIITGKHLEYLVAFLNSRLFKFCFEENFPELQGNTRELNKVIFNEIPIKTPTDEQEVPFIQKVDEILKLKKQNLEADTSKLESEIDTLVYKLYDLTEEEIGIIEGN